VKLPSIVLAALLVAATASTATAEPQQYRIIEGHYSAEPGGLCPPPGCGDPLKAAIAGTFEASAEGGNLYFPSSDLISVPAGQFQLPKDPQTPEYGGEIRTVSFSVSDGGLKVSGLIDSTAFDGAAESYEFRAIAVDEAGFSPNLFYRIRPDLRECASPLCGGAFVKSANRFWTRCADGSLAAECYVAAIDWPLLGLENRASQALNSSGGLLVQGSLRQQTFANDMTLGVFLPMQAYQPASASEPEGWFGGLQDNGIRCITAPCFSITEQFLNASSELNLSDIQFKVEGAPQKLTDQAYELMAKEQVLPVAGRLRITREQAGLGIGLVITQFYLPLTADGLTCPQGYAAEGEQCLTPQGCASPLLELKAVGGAPWLNPETGEYESSVSYSCVQQCEPPAELLGPARCEIYLP